MVLGDPPDWRELNYLQAELTAAHQAIIGTRGNMRRCICRAIQHLKDEIAWWYSEWFDYCEEE
jgi:hypothetical protein